VNEQSDPYDSPLVAEMRRGGIFFVIGLRVSRSCWWNQDSRSPDQVFGFSDLCLVVAD